VTHGYFTGSMSQTLGFLQYPPLRSSQVPSGLRLAPRHGRPGFVMAPAWPVSPVLVPAAARASHAPAAYTDRSPRRAAAAASTPATDPRRCRRSRSQSSTRCSCPDAPQTLGWPACAPRCAPSDRVSAPAGCWPSTWRGRTGVRSWVGNSAPPRGGTGGWLARTQEATRSSAARADEDEARRRQGRLEWRPIDDSGH